MQLVLDTNGLQLKVRNHCFWVIGKNLKRQISPRRVSSIAITADCLVASSAVTLAMKNAIPIFWVDRRGKVVARNWSAAPGGHPALRREQVTWSLTPAATAWLVGLLKEKLTAQRANLKWLASRRARQRDKITTANDRMLQHGKKLTDLTASPITTVRNNIMGIEGVISREYFGVLGKAAAAPWSFPRRSRRPAQDPFNAALNYLYGMLYGTVENAAFAAGLDPYLGVFHADAYRRPTLVFDLIEPFRPWVDRLLLNLIFTNKLNETVCEIKPDGGYWITSSGKRILIPAFHDFMAGRINYSGRQRSRKNHIYLLAGELAKTLAPNNYEEE